MSSKRSEEFFYNNLPRKELQRLCKQCRLPARKSSSQMAQSLQAHFQGPYYLNCLSPSMEEDAGGAFQQMVHSNGLQKTHGGKVEITHEALKADMGCFHRGKTSASISTSKSPAFFEFHVSSEDGIKLCVDLNSSTSDWISKYNGQDLLREALGSSKSRILHQELGQIEASNKKARNSFIHNIGAGQISDIHVRAECSPNSVVDKYIHGGNIGELMTTKIVPSDADAEVSEIVEKDHGPILSNANCGIQNKVYDIELHTKDEFSATMDSDITDCTLEKTVSNFSATPTADPIDSIAIKHQSSKKDDEACHNSNSCNLENTSVVIPGCQASCSMEVQISDAGNCTSGSSYLSQKRDELLTVINSKNNIRMGHDKFVISKGDESFSGQIVTCSVEAGKEQCC